MTHSTLRKNSRRKPRSTDTNTTMGPSHHSINAILAYSKALRVVHAPPVGEIDLILN